MSARLTGWLAAVLVTGVTVALIIGEITDAGQRSWWGSHSLTTDTVSGLLVLLLTILVVNQLLNLRQARQRSHVVAAEAAIVAAQAAQSASAVAAVTSGAGGDRGAAADSYRTYMVMLLISAPVFIQDPIARHFLEQAQNLGGEMTRALAQTREPAGGAVSSDGLNEAVSQLQSAAAPLLQILDPAVRESIQRIGSSDG